MVDEKQVCVDLDPDTRQEIVAIDGQKLTGVCEPGVTDGKPDVEISGRLFDRFERAVLGEVRLDGAKLDSEFTSEILPDAFKQRESPRHEHDVDAARCQVPRHRLADARRRASHDGPGAKEVLVDEGSHLARLALRNPLFGWHWIPFL